MLKTSSLFALLAGALAAAFALAQPTSTSPLAPKPNGPRSAEPTRHVLINATVHPSPGVVWERGVIEIEAGRITRAMEMTEQYQPPAGATVRDAEGLHVYAGFIDLFVEVEAPLARNADADGAHWNAWVTPDRAATDGDGLSASQRESLRSQGFAAALLAPKDHIFAGRTALVGLADPPPHSSQRLETLYADRLHHAMNFQTSGWGDRQYPTSHPGCVAVMRQALLDADWQRHFRTGPANALTPLEDPGAAPLLFNTDHELEALLAADISSEMGRRAVIVGSGTEFRRLEALADARLAMVVPLRFPTKPKVASPGAAEAIELDELMTWEQAPTNARRLHDAGMLVALTTSKMNRGGSFLAHLREAIDAGLEHDTALAMLTTHPAQILREHSGAARSPVADELGRVQVGYRANLTVASAPIFEDDAAVLDVYVDGRRHVVSTLDDAALDGAWRFLVGPDQQPGFEMHFRVSGVAEPGRASVELREGDAEGAARSVSVDGKRISFLIDDIDDRSGTYIVSGMLQPNGMIRGTALDANDNAFEWRGVRMSDDEWEALSPPTENSEDTQTSDDAAAGEDEPENNSDTESGDDPAVADAGDAADDEGGTHSDVPDLPGLPFGPYAITASERDEQPGVTLITNATVWTQSDAGVIENGFVVISDGRLSNVGEMPAPQVSGDARVIDAQGKHVTPGLIDAHSHTGLFRFGVNEAGEAVTSEVRIADSVDPGFISWYRQLAAGVTSVLSLHGSANPIGGQSQTNKVRWGAAHPHDMRLDGSTPGIKFALGENVKQSNWASSGTRYPQTRMGVETIIRDRFTAAREYQRHWDAANAALRRMGKAIPDGSMRNIGELTDSQKRTLMNALNAAGFDQPPRRDLELEPLAEVLRGERLVHCHSYRQDEILMLCRIAEDFGFRIGTFQHGLEVYKVPEAVREHAIGASLFSDWWMYKVEVMDAIPFAGPMQTEAGVLTSYNSDSDELARRMNLEAAKALKYAHRDANNEPVLSEQDALAFVTNNAAVQLGVGDRIGSLEPGMDGDVVIWSDHPLSTLAVVERTFVDGVQLFSLERDAQHRERISSERRRIINKLIDAPDMPRDEAAEDADGAEEMTPERLALAAWYRQEIAAGRDPEAATGGDCGCGLVDHKRHMLEADNQHHTHDH